VNKNKKVLVTGAAGFIGYHLVKKLCETDYQIVGIDNLNDYYDVNLKYNRLAELGISINFLNNNIKLKSNIFENFIFIKSDIADYDFIVNLMTIENFDFVINLAAQAGVRYSIENPRVYLHSNIDGFLSILEGCRRSNVKHLLYASTSSVYGLNVVMPLSEEQNTDRPMALYAATKKANELMAHSYSHLFSVPTTGLRFFTVYGPWGRPDMALFSFTESIINKKPIKIFNHGKMVRDFTFVGDIIESIFRLIEMPPLSNKNEDSEQINPPYQIFNIGNSNPISILQYINELENAIGQNAIKEFVEIQPGDVKETHADTKALENYINYKPNTNIKQGINAFVDWYKNYNKL
jgi:UDP-glucuronate 4-epimerase